MNLPEMSTGTRFMLSDPDGNVVYRGTALPDGCAELDVIAGRGVEPDVWMAQALAHVYDPERLTFGTIGTAV